MFVVMEDPKMLRDKAQELVRAARASEDERDRIHMLRLAAQLNASAREQEETKLLNSFLR
jgi:hypothetical protein